jgi:phosphocarrier protein HPr
MYQKDRKRNKIKFTGKWNRPKRKCGLGKEKIMKEFKYVITDKEGIHARPAGALVKAAASFPCSVTIAKDGKEVDAKRIFGVMGLGVKCGEEITVCTDGENEEAASAAIEAFLKANL